MSDHAVILLAEDREDDVVIIRRAFLQGRILNPLFVVKDGEEVISYLSGEGKYSNRAEYPLPELLLLDLKMPKVSGIEVCRRLVDAGTKIVVTWRACSDVSRPSRSTSTRAWPRP
jgi:CheY-like chemotaxis protein